MGSKQLTWGNTHKQVYTANTGLLCQCQQRTCKASLWGCTADGEGMCPKNVWVCAHLCVSVCVLRQGCVCVCSGGFLYKIHDRRQTYPIFHRSPETQLNQRAFKPVTHSNRSLQLWVGWETASTWLCQRLWNQYLWEGITVSAKRNERFCNRSLIPSGSVSTKDRGTHKPLECTKAIMVMKFSLVFIF